MKSLERHAFRDAANACAMHFPAGAKQARGGNVAPQKS
jgi:hypothetical protein